MSQVLASKLPISKNLLRDEINNTFHLKEEIIKYLSYYNIHKYSSSYLFNQIKEGTIIKDGIIYIVVYYNCTRYKAKLAKDCFVSFRSPNPEFELHPTVLVKPAESNETLTKELEK